MLKLKISRWESEICKCCKRQPTFIFVVIYDYNVIQKNVVRPWIFDFFDIIFSTSMVTGAFNIGRTRLKLCHKMENCRSYLNIFRALFTERIRSYDHFRFLKENLVIWERTTFWVISGQIREQNSQFQFQRDFYGDCSFFS